MKEQATDNKRDKEDFLRSARASSERKPASKFLPDDWHKIDASKEKPQFVPTLVWVADQRQEQ